jgi:transposase-like protein
VTAGTIFHDSHKPLVVWFRAMWWMTNQKTGLSALGLQRLLGFGSYRTAWTMLHKLRNAMVRPGRERLSGNVEVDDCYWGAPEPGASGRGTHNKAMIAVAAEKEGNGIGRIRLGCVVDGSASHLHDFIERAIAPGSTIHTDDWPGYRGIEAKGYRHVVTVVKHSGKAAHELLPRAHKTISLLKRWLMGTHQGATSHEHLSSYLDEFVFRFNRRTSAHRGKLFLRLAQQAVAVEPVPYAYLVRGVRQSRAPTTTGRGR